MNNQEIFDRVVERLRDGTGRAVSFDDRHDGCCQYKTEIGLKCAVGIFIKEGHEAQRFGGPIHSLLGSYNPNEIFGFEVDDATLDLLDNLQMAHDCTAHWNGKQFNKIGEYDLKGIAEKFNLNYTSP